jgi:GntP family gluconate:H+ symporter
MFTTYGALIGLAIAIFLIIRKVTPAYALIFGALAGGLIGGGGLTDTVAAMIDGTKAMMPSVLRILASGVLVGALVKTGSAAKIADAIVGALGTRLALTAVALSTMIVCAVGVFIDIAVITVAPVALAVGRKAKLPVSALLVAMIGGGKAGNIISPNPNTIAAADAFKIELTSLMGANIIPAIAALVVTILISTIMARRAGDVTTEVAEDDVASATDLPSFMQAVIGPLTVVVLLALRPLFGIAVDPLVALPVGGLVCNLVTGKWRDTVANSEFGLSKVIGVSILLIGTGTIAGIVKDSGLNQDIIALLGALHLPTMALAPVSGFLMAGATASTTAGATIASQTFSGTLVSAGVPALASAAMIHAGATIIDSLPHGSFFHATGGAVGMSVKDRLKLIPYEAAVGLTSTVVAVVLAACAR